IKATLWGTREVDTYPVAYKMNTRRSLRHVFRTHGFREVYFAYLSDCRTFFRFRILHYFELSLWHLLHRLNMTYPENCLLGVYERCETDWAANACHPTSRNELETPRDA